MSLTSIQSFASNLSLQSNQSYQSFSDFSEYNNDFELGNDWGLYEDIEIASSENNYNSTKITPKDMREKYGLLDLSIPPFNKETTQQEKHNQKMQRIAKILEKRIPELHERSMLLQELDQETNEDQCISKCLSEFLTNRVIFTTFVIVMLILK